MVYLFNRTPGSEWALAQAKRNVVEKYALVGVTEQMIEFLRMLEFVVPGGMFRNASEHFKHSKFLVTRIVLENKLLHYMYK